MFLRHLSFVIRQSSFSFFFRLWVRTIPPTYNSTYVEFNCERALTIGNEGMHAYLQSDFGRHPGYFLFIFRYSCIDGSVWKEKGDIGFKRDKEYFSISWY